MIYFYLIHILPGTKKMNDVIRKRIKDATRALDFYYSSHM